ncbi:hypothetical protein Mkiyose1665_51790 [Mycobacterium kiyosense]|uniref:Uncharacterized protein n=1 Tax=Mycobacterium kiyosense TaxID=2871094 RepID=A0AA37Q1Y8_9MYCO|nr:hypothetical protein [Mycobacterium kiyosense]GLB85072.1 hypothetical protein SRL2020028_43280 [Mycobacterium kiyosense]GLB98132.1 hypothetical protein SRL2020226_49080 [Mycobacterium kiyosense]GLD44679.1 hypothetical protein Mkiyose1665_51790 [Mycobacterium kiyosense]
MPDRGRLHPDIWHAWRNAQSSRRAAQSTYHTATRTGWYPLLQWGWTRADCHRFVLDILGEAIPKSACGFCPFPMATATGRSQQGQRYRTKHERGTEALLLEFVARSLRSGPNADREQQRRRTYRPGRT